MLVLGMASLDSCSAAVAPVDKPGLCRRSGSRLAARRAPRDGDSMSVGVQLLLLMTVLSLVPAILMMVTSFIRIAIVLSLRPQRHRHAADAAEPDPAGPVAVPDRLRDGPGLDHASTTTPLQPYLRQPDVAGRGHRKGSSPCASSCSSRLASATWPCSSQLGKLPQPNTPDDVPTYVLIPAFMISELKTAFQMGFMILLPFVVIDMVVSSALMSMGMMMLPPDHDLAAVQGAPVRDGGRLVPDLPLARDQLRRLNTHTQCPPCSPLPRMGRGWGRGLRR